MTFPAPTREGTLDIRLATMKAMLVLSAFSFVGMPALGDVPVPLVQVGDPENAADVTGHGAVAGEYWVGTYEVTNAQYAALLNAVAATDSFNLYNDKMSIVRSGPPGSYTYSTQHGDEPVCCLSWYDALRFVNWLHNGQPIGPQDARTTEDGAYTFIGPTAVGSRNPGAKYWLPSEDEWYKAAYHHGGADPGYWDYPTQSSIAPAAVQPAGAENSANYDNAAGGTAVVGSYAASPSYYGTFDQGGNVWEWTETAIGESRGLRGGCWEDYDLLLHARYRDSEDPEAEFEFVGFRVAASAPGPVEGTLFRRGYVNDDGVSDISDAISILGYLFLAGAAPSCFSSADVNDDGQMDISDGVMLLMHLFSGSGKPIPPPISECGLDPTPDGLSCEQPRGCQGGQ